MKHPFRAGTLAVAVAGVALIAPLALPASAALKSTVSCKSVSSPPSSTKKPSTFAGCTPPALQAGGTGGLAKTPPPGSTKGQLGFTVTWNGGMGKSVAAVTFTVLPATKKGNCKAGTLRVTVAGTVKSGTGKVTSIIKNGEPVAAAECVITTGAKAGQSSLAPGTAFKL
jgi:hypothetical protein